MSELARVDLKPIENKLELIRTKEHLEELRRQKAAFVDRITPIVAIAEQKAEAWKADERRKAQQEQDRINEQRRVEAQRRADEERREAEAKAKADREQRERDLAAARKKGEINKREQEKLAKQAVEDERKAKEMAAKQAAETAANVQTVTVKPSVPVVAGIKARVNWKFRIVNANKIPREYLEPNEVAIGSYVRGLKQAGEVIPGVEAYSEDGV
jgi:colicin import membrane protein